MVTATVFRYGKPINKTPKEKPILHLHRNPMVLTTEHIPQCNREKALLWHVYTGPRNGFCRKIKTENGNRAWTGVVSQRFDSPGVETARLKWLIYLVEQHCFNAFNQPTFRFLRTYRDIPRKTSCTENTDFLLNIHRHFV
jgi:hypothetical protein